MTERLTKEQKEWKIYLDDPFRLVLLVNPKLKENPKFKELKDWYYDRVKELPLMEVNIGTPFADGEQWVAEGADADKRIVERVVRADGTFYQFIGGGIRLFKVDGGEKKNIFSWNQGFKRSVEITLEFNLLGENVRLPIYGVLGTIKDTDGNMLMTVGQEPAAESPNHAIFRLPIQASSGKIDLLMKGEKNVDNQLANLLEIFGTDIFGLFDKAEVTIPVSAGDTNMEIKHNILAQLKVDVGSNIHSNLVADGSRKWLSPEQVSMIGVARLMNDHTLGAVQLTSFYSVISLMEGNTR